MTAAPFVPKSLADIALENFPVELRGYISASQLNMFRRCPEQFRRRYVLGEKVPPGPALVQGRADHEAVEANFVQKINSHEDLPTGEVQARFAQAFDTTLDEFGGPAELDWNEDDPVTGADAKKKAAVLLDDGVRLVTAYHEQVSPLVQPLRVEDKFEVQLGGLPIPVKGAIDAIVEPSERALANVLAVAQPDGQRILERKTTKRNAVNPEWQLQRRIYQAVKPLPFEWQLSVKKKNPEIVAGVHVFQPEPQVMLVAQVRRTMVALAECFALYGPDQPWPDATTHTWSCSFCGFRPTCPWWRGDLWK
jgi:hypothetical protein